MPSLNKTRIISVGAKGDLRQADAKPANLLPLDFDFSTIPGAVFATVKLPGNMPAPLKLNAIGDIEKMKADGVKWYRIMIYLQTPTAWRLYCGFNRDMSLPPPVGRADTMMTCTIGEAQQGKRIISALSGETVTALIQVIGAIADIAVDVESG